MELFRDPIEDMILRQTYNMENQSLFGIGHEDDFIRSSPDGSIGEIPKQAPKNLINNNQHENVFNKLD